MPRVLMFGDSQVASFAPILPQVVDAVSGLDFTFVCAPGPVSKVLQVEGTSLCLAPAPETWKHAYVPDKSLARWYSHTAEQIREIDASGVVDLTQFDAIVCAGGHITAYWQIVHDAVTATHLSSACLARICSDVFSKTRHMQWLTAIRVDGTAIFSLPDPLLNEESPRISTLEFMGKAYRPVEDALSRVVADAGSRYISIPPGILAPEGNATAARFRIDRDGDYGHVNEEGAHLIVQQLLKALAPLRAAMVPSSVS